MVTASNFLLNGMKEKESFGIFPWVEKYVLHIFCILILRLHPTYMYRVCMLLISFPIMVFVFDLFDRFCFCFLVLGSSICNVVSISDTLKEVCIPDMTAVDMLEEYARSAHIEGVVSCMPFS